MSISTIERVVLLKSAEIFNPIPSEELVPLAQIAQEVFFQAGETIIRQGEVGNCLYMIVGGDVAVVIPGVGQVAIRGPKQSLGEMAVVSGGERSADCIALSDVAALRVDHDDFWDLLAERPALALGVIKVLSSRLDEAVANLKKAGQVQPDL